MSDPYGGVLENTAVLLPSAEQRRGGGSTEPSEQHRDTAGVSACAEGRRLAHYQFFLPRRKNELPSGMGTIFSFGPENSGFRGATPAARGGEQSDKQTTGLQTHGAVRQPFFSPHHSPSRPSMARNSSFSCQSSSSFWGRHRSTHIIHFVSSSIVMFFVQNHPSRRIGYYYFFYPCIFVLLLLVFVPLVFLLFLLPARETLPLPWRRSDGQHTTTTRRAESSQTTQTT